MESNSWRIKPSRNYGSVGESSICFFTHLSIVKYSKSSSNVVLNDCSHEACGRKGVVVDTSLQNVIVLQAISGY